MKTFLATAFVLLVALAASAPAQAANKACFDWDCDDTTLYCTFDASCTELDGSLWRYSWNFGDGSGNTLTGSTTIAHQYTYSYPHPDVTLTVVPYDVDSFYVTCEIIVYNQVSPPLATYGRCSQ